MKADERTRRVEIEAALAFFRRAAALFPLDVINAFAGDLANPDAALSRSEYQHHGSAIATSQQWRWAIEGYRELGALASELGFRFAFETHGCYLHDNIEATMRLVESIDSQAVGLLWDHANLQLFPNKPSFGEVIQRCGSKLFYLHLKNLLAAPEKLLAVTSLSAGILNVREQLRLLAASGYNGPVCLESPRAGDRIQFAKEDLSYFRGLLDDLRESR
jgi:sugar phosphate isomerase/epimerase